MLGKNAIRAMQRDNVNRVGRNVCRAREPAWPIVDVVKDAELLPLKKKKSVLLVDMGNVRDMLKNESSVAAVVASVR